MHLAVCLIRLSIGKKWGGREGGGKGGRGEGRRKEGGF